MKSILKILSIVLLLSAYGCFKSKKKVYTNTEDIPVHREMKAELTAPPNVPRPVGERKAKKLIVEMEILEKEGELTDGVRYVFWTFGGTVPGSFIRTRVGRSEEHTSE